MGQTNILKVARKIPNLFEKHNFTETNITIAKVFKIAFDSFDKRTFQYNKDKHSSITRCCEQG